MENVIALMGFFLLTGTPALVAAPVDQVPQPSTEEVVGEVLVYEPAPHDTEGISITLTGYNAVPEQTDSNPFVTASGLTSNPEVIAARSHDLADDLPFGTIISIERPAYQDPRKCHFDSVVHLTGYRVIADTTHKRKRAQIDVLFDHTSPVVVGERALNPGVALGVCDEVIIRVVGRMSLDQVPDSQEALAYALLGSGTGLATR